MRCQFRLPAEVRKGGLCDRYFPLGADTIGTLNKIPRTASGPFLGVICLGTIYNRFEVILKRAGLPADRRSKFHRIRRTTLSHYKAAGGDAQALAGHSSGRVTALYLDPRIVRQPSAPDLLFRPGA